MMIHWSLIKIQISWAGKSNIFVDTREGDFCFIYYSQNTSKSTGLLNTKIFALQYFPSQYLQVYGNLLSSDVQLCFNFSPSNLNQLCFK